MTCMNGYYSPWRPPVRRRRGLSFLLATLILVVLPGLVAVVTGVFASDAEPVGCDDSVVFGCMSPRETVVFLSIIAAIFLIPLWIGTMIVLGVLNAIPQTRTWPALGQLAVAVPIGGLAMAAQYFLSVAV
jgi:hypothetical protein